jgi:hypothetical protein
MRYWAYLVGKVVLAVGPVYGLLLLIERTFPAPPKDANLRLHYMNNELLGALFLLGWFLICAGTLYLIVWDQRRRCRVCLRKLRMPIETGSRSYMLQLGQPAIESICPYGHGTLKEEELQITGRDTPEWKPHSGDIWGKNCALPRRIPARNRESAAPVARGGWLFRAGGAGFLCVSLRSGLHS